MHSPRRSTRSARWPRRFLGSRGIARAHGAARGSDRRARRRLLRPDGQSRRAVTGDRARRPGARSRVRARNWSKLSCRRECSLRDLGEHRLKDLARPERIYQLLAPDLIADFPPLRSLEHLSNNLPAQLSSFVGRETEIAEITALIEQHRLVTLVGSGGVGKTRLSLQVAPNLHRRLRRRRVVRRTRAAEQAASTFPSTVAQALGIHAPDRRRSGGEPRSRAQGKAALLVFDNCEHLVEPAARVISAILHAAPKVKVLASSRQGLGVAGEETYRAVP